ncbi:MAG: MOSC domain-containing protein [Pedosphaera sp.]|nr:MOSC domain-containing protein [Pedosphaera sp.]
MNPPNNSFYRSRAELDAGLMALRLSPIGRGIVTMIVARPLVNERKPMNSVSLTPAMSLTGDRWKKNSGELTLQCRRQLTVFNMRVAGLVAGPRERWPLSGDNFIVDMDLSTEALASGRRLRIGTALIEIRPECHDGCSKFAARFGPDALDFVNSLEGKRLRLRGLLAMVIEPGIVTVGDDIVAL